MIVKMSSKMIVIFRDEIIILKNNVTIQPPSKRIPFLGVFVNDM